MKIAGRTIGEGPPYIVAEISCNHEGSLNKAKELIDAAQQAGADAVKFQTYKPGDLTRPGNKELWALYERALTPLEWHEELFAYSRERGLAAFSSPFSVWAVEYLNPMQDVFKIASPEALRSDIVDAVAKTGKPAIISTGCLSNLQQVKYLAGKFPNRVFLHCVSNYPARVADSNLRMLGTLLAYSQLVGLSDHTPGYAAPVAATIMGACMIEKHIKIDDNCIDAEWSLNPKEFADMAEAVRDVWHGLGDGNIRTTGKPRDL